MAAERLTDADLAEIEARADAATPGPWRNDGGCRIWAPVPPKKVDWFPGKEEIVLTEGKQFEATGSDNALMAHSRTDVPRLLAEVRALRAEVDAAHRTALITLYAVKAMTRQAALHEALRIIETSSSWLEQIEKIRELIAKEE